MSLFGRFLEYRNKIKVTFRMLIHSRIKDNERLKDGSGEGRRWSSVRDSMDSQMAMCPSVWYKTMADDVASTPVPLRLPSPFFL